MATASRRPRSCPRCSAPSWSEAFGEFKAIWDPDNKMNPHKVVDPYLPGENLRLGPHYHPPQVETHFKFPDDKGSFAYATERCVGIGECRKEDSRDHVPELHGDQGGDATRPEGARTCSSRCSRATR